jgi:hypothetical protein
MARYPENGNIGACGCGERVRTTRGRDIGIAVTTDGVVVGGQVIGPPSIASNFTLGTRNSLPNRITGKPLNPPVARYSRPSAYAAVRPIRRIAAASSIVRKSGTAETTLIHTDSRSRRRPVSNFFISPFQFRRHTPVRYQGSEKTDTVVCAQKQPSCCHHRDNRPPKTTTRTETPGRGAVGSRTDTPEVWHPDGKSSDTFR